MRFNIRFTLPCMTLAFAFFGMMGVLRGEYLAAAISPGAIALMWWSYFKLDRFTQRSESAFTAYGSHIVSKTALQDAETEEEDEHPQGG